MANPEKTSAELLQEMEKRKDWFFECQLRRLYLEAFRDVEAAGNDSAMLQLISEPATMTAPLGSSVTTTPLVYLDSQQKLWTREERDQRLAFKDITTGSYGNWLNYGVPTRLADKLADLKTKFESSKFSSVCDFILELNAHGREDPAVNTDKPKDRDLLSHAISRAAIAAKKPWLIPELFNEAPTAFDLAKWVDNGEVFIRNYENELIEILGGQQAVPSPPAADQPDLYRKWIKDILAKSLQPGRASTTKVEFVDESCPTWKFNIKIGTPGATFDEIGKYPLSASVKYWIDACNSSLKEVYVLKSESDMGLCLVMRALYLYGSLDAPVFTGKDIPWRQPGDQVTDFTVYDKFFEEQGKLVDIFPGVHDREDLKKKIAALKTRLKILLEEAAGSPASGSVCFSPLAQEVMKQAILVYKFWLDEPYNAYEYHNEKQDDDAPQGINRARSDTGTGVKYAEMEHWSENHYIMFASSEYLAGQLWPAENFQPGRGFLTAEDNGKFGVLTGEQRKQRGKARILKWLHNKLMFGWTEFNSSGYYREHLWSLLNLVDFAADEDIRKKATIVTDLLLFDVLRFTHKGSMGAAGGRSQFPSKNSGWDNALGDAIEIILGQRGIFTNKSGEIGCSFATSMYTIPRVLLQIANYPPDAFPIDRCRISIGFDDAPKYGIDYSQSSDQFDSLFQGYAAKRLKHFKFLLEVNAAIVATHTDYGPWQDDTMFWWSQSAFFNKQVVRNTFKCVKQFKLFNCKAFSDLRKAFDIISNIIKVIDVVGFIGGLAATGPAGFGAAAFFFDGVAENHLEHLADEVSLFFEGSTRSRANIYSYHNGDVMLSSIQNFRTGQLNFQSNVSQATISTGVNVFTTAGFLGIEISDFAFMAAGGVLGGLGAYALGVAGVAGIGLGIAGGALLNEGVPIIGIKVRGTELGDQGDGPGWWTGNWSLPMVVQHQNAAILAFDYSWLQRRITDVGSHTWFPKAGFDETHAMRSSAYKDDNLMDFSFDLKEFPDFGYGPRGYWLFGKKIHKHDPLNPDADEEGYIGVFSNREPEWQDKDNHLYKSQIKLKEKDNQDFLDAVDEKIKDIKDRTDSAACLDKDAEIAKINQQAADIRRTWKDPIPTDFFAEKDWYVQGKNIWIIQVGSKKEYGSYENFKDKVSSAKVVVDDAGTMGCAYHIPQPDGSSQVLSLKYKDEIKLDGNDFQSDFYPRFENHFIRSGRVEWGQREYVIEYRGEKLLHDFSDMNLPVRSEYEAHSPEDEFTIKALIVYLKTTDEEMETFTVATATVNIGCTAVATDEIIAVGHVEENNYHDAEWIFFDSPGFSSPYMTIDIAHHTMAGKGRDNTKWTMTYSLKALMGDRSLQPCTVSTVPSASFYFRDNSRTTGPVPFSVTLLRWRNWKAAYSTDHPYISIIARQPRDNHYYFDHADQFRIDKENIISHRSIGPCDNISSWTELNRFQNQGEPGIQAPYRWYACSTQPGYTFLFLVSNGSLFARWLTPGQQWYDQPWHKLDITYLHESAIFGDDTQPTPVKVPLWPLSFIAANTVSGGVVEPAVYVSGIDGNIYTSSKWPLDVPGHWHQIETASEFPLLHSISFQVVGNFLIALDTNRNFWQYTIPAQSSIFQGAWEQLPAPPFVTANFVTAMVDDALHIAACSTEGRIWAIVRGNEPGTWEPVGQQIGFQSVPDAELACATPTNSRLDLFIVGLDKKLYSTWWTKATGWENGHNWLSVAAESQTFQAAADANLTAISRVDGQLEVYVTDTNGINWKNWWS